MSSPISYVEPNLKVTETTGEGWGYLVFNPKTFLLSGSSCLGTASYPSITHYSEYLGILVSTDYEIWSACTDLQQLSD